MKSISPLIATILLVVIVVGLSAISYVFLTNTFGGLVQQSTQQIQAISDISVLSIVNAYFDGFYDNFEYLDTNKWTISRYSNDTNLECVVESGTLWLVKKSVEKGCNIKLNTMSIKWNDTYVIDLRFNIDYVCGSSNDGDGMAIVIDGKDTTPLSGCNKGFNNVNQGIVIEIFDDAPNTSANNGLGIDNDTVYCSRTADTTMISYWGNGWDKRYDLNDGIISVNLTGSRIILNYQDLNPSNGLVNTNLSTDLWNPNGLGYFMIGAGTGCSVCNSNACDQPDSAHGIDWIIISRDGFPIKLVVYNPFPKPVNLNGTYISINGCVLPMLYGETFLTSTQSSIIEPQEQVIVKIRPIYKTEFCELKIGDNNICLSYEGKTNCRTIRID